MTKTKVDFKKIIQCITLFLCCFALLLCFSACDKPAKYYEETYEKQIAELQEQLNGSIYVVNLTKETASNVKVKENFEFLIQIKDSGSFTYFDSTNSVTFQIFRIAYGSWVNYEQQRTTNTCVTFGADIYKIKIIDIDNATSTTISILQTAEQRT